MLWQGIWVGGCTSAEYGQLPCPFQNNKNILIEGNTISYCQTTPLMITSSSDVMVSPNDVVFFPRQRPLPLTLFAFKARARWLKVYAHHAAIVSLKCSCLSTRLFSAAGFFSSLDVPSITASSLLPASYMNLPAAAAAAQNAQAEPQTLNPKPLR